MVTIIPRVIDLSHYDDVQDNFVGAKSVGIWGVINKVTEGVGGHDKSFEWRRQPVADQGMLYGGYHFIRPGRIKEQAHWFVQNLGPGSHDLLMALDHEDRGVSLNDARLWLEIVHGMTGRWPKFYSGFLVKEQLGNRVDPFWQNIKLWLSQYGPTPRCPKTWNKPWLWQFTGDSEGPEPHNIPGIVIHGGKGIDINSYEGDESTLRTEWA